MALDLEPPFPNDPLVLSGKTAALHAGMKYVRWRSIVPMFMACQRRPESTQFELSRPPWIGNIDRRIAKLYGYGESEIKPNVYVHVCTYYSKLVELDSNLSVVKDLARFVVLLNFP